VFSFGIATCVVPQAAFCAHASAFQPSLCPGIKHNTFCCCCAACRLFAVGYAARHISSGAQLQRLLSNPPLARALQLHVGTWNLYQDWEAGSCCWCGMRLHNKVSQAYGVGLRWRDAGIWVGVHSVPLQCVAEACLSVWRASLTILCSGCLTAKLNRQCA
jgi:hypothetical protein